MNEFMHSFSLPEIYAVSKESSANRQTDKISRIHKLFHMCNFWIGNTASSLQNTSLQTLCLQTFRTVHL